MTLGSVGAAASVIVTVKPVGVRTVLPAFLTDLNVDWKTTVVMSAPDASAGVDGFGAPVTTPWPLIPFASPVGSVICGLGAVAAWPGRAATQRPARAEKVRSRTRMP